MEMDKKKVGIVTFHTADNYGAVLQAYALQHYIERNIGYKVNIIDFCTSSHIKDYQIIKKRSNNLIKSIILNLIVLFHYKSLKERAVKFEFFREKYLYRTKHRYTTDEDFIAHMENFDFYISGSDQVFNPNIKYSKCYYLGFIGNRGKKIAYAPSFGIVDFTSKQRNFIKTYVRDFSSLSCREMQGAKFLSSLTGTKVEQVCDPVYLLESGEWRNISSKIEEKKPYIFVYDLCGGEELIRLAMKIRQKHQGMSVICATQNLKKKYKGVKSLFNVGPQELLGYIDHASFVVTDSFHGTSLSLILNKKVIVYIALKHVASRITSLMSNLGIHGQIVEDVDKFDYDAIDFPNYKERLNQFILSSKQYLKKALQ